MQCTGYSSCENFLNNTVYNLSTVHTVIVQLYVSLKICCFGVLFYVTCHYWNTGNIE